MPRWVTLTWNIRAIGREQGQSERWDLETDEAQVLAWEAAGWCRIERHSGDTTTVEVDNRMVDGPVNDREMRPRVKRGRPRKIREE